MCSFAYSNPQDHHFQASIASDSTPLHFYNQPIRHLHHRANSQGLMLFACYYRLEGIMGFGSSSLWIASGSSGQLRSELRFTMAIGELGNDL